MAIIMLGIKGYHFYQAVESKLMNAVPINMVVTYLLLLATSHYVWCFFQKQLVQ